MNPGTSLRAFPGTVRDAVLVILAPMVACHHQMQRVLDASYELLLLAFGRRCGMQIVRTTN